MVSQMSAGMVNREIAKAAKQFLGDDCALDDAEATMAALTIDDSRDLRLAELERALAQTTRRDETALAARIAVLEETVRALTERVDGLDARLRS